MRLPSPLAAYRRWRYRRQCRQAGITPELADELNEVGRTANKAGRRIADVAYALLTEGYEGNALMAELERRVAIIAD